MVLPNTAMITGITGQDGAYLARHLLNRGYKVWGGTRHSSRDTQWRLEELGILDDIHFIDFDILEQSDIIDAVDVVEPDEIYNLAAQSIVGASFIQPIYTSQVNATGVLYLLEAIRATNPRIKFYQASTSDMFGENDKEPLHEHSIFFPASPYGTSKLCAHFMTVSYRRSYDLFTCTGILFNHESPLRGLEFVTRKITHGFARVKSGDIPCILLGNIDVNRDWGHADDLTLGMYLILQHESPDDYVLATGKSHTLKEFIATAALICGWNVEWSGKGMDEVGFDRNTGKELVKIDPKYFRPHDIQSLEGNSGKARQILGWSPKYDFTELVSEMMEADLRRVKRK